ncbi:MAG: DMT family transporter [Gemmatimonadaceae bacterium]
MRSEGRSVSRATALIVLSACCFGSLTTLTLLVTRAGLPLLPAMVWRYFLAAVVLAALVRPWTRSSITVRQALRLMIIGGCGQATITYFSLRALDYLPVGALGFLFYTYPAWVAVIAAVTGREELTLLRFTSLAVAMAGITVMVGTPFSAALNPIGVMLALGTAFLFALYLPALHRMQRGITPLVSTFYLVAGVLISFALSAALTGNLRFPETPSIWTLLLALSIVGTVLAFVALISGLRTLGPVRTSIIATIEPFFTAMLGVLILSEPFTAATLAGGALIACAVLMLQWNGRARSRVEPAT